MGGHDGGGDDGGGDDGVGDDGVGDDGDLIDSEWVLVSLYLHFVFCSEQPVWLWPDGRG